MSSKSCEIAIRTSTSNFNRRNLCAATVRRLNSAQRGNRENEPAIPDAPGLKFDRPHGKNLRTLIDALEAFLGFGDGFDRRDPVITRVRGLDGYADFLPFIDEAQLRRGRGAEPAQGIPFARHFDITIGRVWREEIDNELEAHVHFRGNFSDIGEL